MGARIFSPKIRLSPLRLTQQHPVGSPGWQSWARPWVPSGRLLMPTTLPTRFSWHLWLHCTNIPTRTATDAATFKVAGAVTCRNSRRLLTSTPNARRKPVPEEMQTAVVVRHRGLSGGWVMPTADGGAEWPRPRQSKPAVARASGCQHPDFASPIPAPPQLRPWGPLAP